MYINVITTKQRKRSTSSALWGGVGGRLLRGGSLMCSPNFIQRIIKIFIENNLFCITTLEHFKSIRIIGKLDPLQGSIDDFSSWTAQPGGIDLLKRKAIRPTTLTLSHNLQQAKVFPIPPYQFEDVSSLHWKHQVGVVEVEAAELLVVVIDFVWLPSVVVLLAIYRFSPYFCFLSLWETSPQDKKPG